MTGRSIRRGVVSALAAVALVAATLVAASAPPAQAADGSDFDPGNIISDAVFFNSSTMSADQVQQFLSLKGAGCTAGEAACLKDYRAATTARDPEPGLCGGYPATEQSAAQMIAGVAASCGVNPRVLIVLLEKEQSLVTRTKPTARSYQTATGYGCPDSAPCDAQYYGLFNQLYMAARQYQRYAASPTSYGYRAGRTNTIQYNPNSACGTAQVYIVNQATAGLYNYTPYVPNAAALANLYGTGDGCSSYGNRNFWRLYTDWFGSAQANTYLVRTPENATVYLVSGSSKYPIASMDVLVALTPLGTVGYVSQQYLDHHATGPVVGRALLAPDGTVYYFDAGIRLSFGTCTQVADFGQSCGTAVPVDAGIVSALYNGGRMTNLFRTTSGKAYYVQGGQRHEVADDASLVGAGLSTVGVTLLETGVSYLPVGSPISRPGLVITARAGTGTGTFVDVGGTFAPVDEQMLGAGGLNTLPRATLDASSLRAVPWASTIAPLMTDAATSTGYLLTTSGKVAVDAAAVGPATVPATAGTLGLLPSAGTATSPVLVKTADNGTVYLLRGGELRTLRSWGDLLAIAGTDTPTIWTIPAGTARLLPAGPVQVAPGTLTIAPGDGTVYLMDGLDGRLTVGAFAVTDELGATRLVSLSAGDLARYTVRPGMASIAVTCGGAQYLGLAGRLVPVPAAMVPVYALSFQTMDPLTCANLPRSAQVLDRFLHTPDGTIYYMDGGLKRPITSWARYVELGGTAANTLDVTLATVRWFVTGPNA